MFNELFLKETFRIRTILFFAHSIAQKLPLFWTINFRGPYSKIMAASDNSLPFQNNYYSRISLNISFLLYSILLFFFSCVLIFSQLIMSFILWPSEMHTWEYAAVDTSYKNKKNCSCTKKQCKIMTFIAYWLALVGSSWLWVILG